ncbi:MAG: hypothetical protein K8M05_17890 [Deltaproteobacteria bacterium]|nr:hypothetical protein [Kofleriaceae bacterium]
MSTDEPDDKDKQDPVPASFSDLVEPPQPFVPSEAERERGRVEAPVSPADPEPAPPPAPTTATLSDLQAAVGVTPSSPSPSPSASASPSASPSPSPAPPPVAPSEGPKAPGRRAHAPKPQAPKSSLADEVALVDDAMAALRRDDARAALAAADDHVARFGKRGQLAEEASAIRVESLCRLGDARWSSALDDFDARFPRSAQRPRLTSACKGVQ